jgi:hypothetical protein
MLANLAGWRAVALGLSRISRARGRWRRVSGPLAPFQQEGLHWRESTIDIGRTLQLKRQDMARRATLAIGALQMGNIWATRGNRG